MYLFKNKSTSIKDLCLLIIFLSVSTSVYIPVHASEKQLSDEQIKRVQHYSRALLVSRLAQKKAMDIELKSDRVRLENIQNTIDELGRQIGDVSYLSTPSYLGTQASAASSISHSAPASMKALGSTQSLLSIASTQAKKRHRKLMIDKARTTLTTFKHDRENNTGYTEGMLEWIKGQLNISQTELKSSAVLRRQKINMLLTQIDKKLDTINLSDPKSIKTINQIKHSLDLSKRQQAVLPAQIKPTFTTMTKHRN